MTSELQLARAKVRSLESQVATTKAKLTRIEALSTRQQTILRRTGVVLGRVDPLLSGADELQQLTGEIKIARDAFEADSQQAMSEGARRPRRCRRENGLLSRPSRLRLVAVWSEPDPG